MRLYEANIRLESTGHIIASFYDYEAAVEWRGRNLDLYDCDLLIEALI